MGNIWRGMGDPTAYHIDDIVTSRPHTTSAFEDIRGLTERVTQQKLSVTPDAYGGPHYTHEDGLAIIRKQQGNITGKDTLMETARRVESHWSEGFEVISENDYWASSSVID
jgi:hypothetical protein